MQEREIRAELIGIKLSGIYPTGMLWSEVIATDGTTAYEENGKRSAGKWQVAGELFCFAYELPMESGCFRVVKQSPNCYELYTASLGGHAPATPPPAANMAWNGRMWRETTRSTCEEKPIS